MTDATDEIILHNYPQSPVAEKVRVVLGIKNLDWLSVEIPRIPPKPMLVKLTGGYRRTPVMQIGADIYCDSQCIIRALEQRIPEPTLFPTSDAGLMWCLGRWMDDTLFELTIKIVLGAGIENLPPEFAEDRGRLYLGADWADNLKAASEAVAHLASQVRAPYHWLDQQLCDGRNFLLGEHPGAIDAQVYFTAWFLRGRWDQGPQFLSQFPALCRWEENVKTIGHGRSSLMAPQDALSRAAGCQPLPVVHQDVVDTQGLKNGMQVAVVSDVDGGELPVIGEVAAANAETITLRRHEPQIGDVHVHFPRAGYLVKPV